MVKFKHEGAEYLYSNTKKGYLLTVMENMAYRESSKCLELLA